MYTVHNNTFLGLELVAKRQREADEASGKASPNVTGSHKHYPMTRERVNCIIYS